MIKRLLLTLGVLALAFSISMAGPELNVSGQWNSNIGAVYNIQQSGNQYTWSAPSLNQSGTGTISGNTVTMSGPGWTIKGTITESDQAGNATKIVGENGVILVRTAAGPTAPPPTPAKTSTPSTPAAPPGQGFSISGQWNSSIGAVYNIQQSGNQYTWSAPSLNQSGTGTVSGKAVTISGPGWTVKGTITEADQAGNATKIVGENGVVLFRTMAGPVPFQLQKPPAGTPARAKKVNVNSATAADLQTLPGITPALAQQILGGRPYKSLDGLARAGLSKAQIESVRPYIRVWSPSGAKNHYYRLAPGEKINLNTASASMLVALPGIGKGMAAAIMKNRPYTRIEDLMRVKGIKQGTFERVKAFVKV